MKRYHYSICNQISNMQNLIDFFCPYFLHHHNQEQDDYLQKMKVYPHHRYHHLLLHIGPPYHLHVLLCVSYCFPDSIDNCCSGRCRYRLMSTSRVHEEELIMICCWDCPVSKPSNMKLLLCICDIIEFVIWLCIPNREDPPHCHQKEKKRRDPREWVWSKWSILPPLELEYCCCSWFYVVGYDDHPFLQQRIAQTVQKDL